MGRWDLNIPKDMLPEVHVQTLKSMARQLTFHFYGGQVPIAGMAGDQQSCCFWSISLWICMIKNTYGTGSFSSLWIRVRDAVIRKITCWRRLVVGSMTRSTILMRRIYHFIAEVPFSGFVTSAYDRQFTWVRGLCFEIPEPGWSLPVPLPLWVLGTLLEYQEARGSVFGLTRGERPRGRTLSKTPFNHLPIRNFRYHRHAGRC